MKPTLFQRIQARVILAWREFKTRRSGTPIDWRDEKSCWIAYKIRAFNSPTVYWGPFTTWRELEAWATEHVLDVSVVEVKNPQSDPGTWWD